LVNINTGHTVELQPDNVREYRSPHFLGLRCQLTIEGETVKIEPIFGNPPLAVTRLKRATARLEIMNDSIRITDIHNISGIEEIDEGTLRITWTGQFLNPDYAIMATQTGYCDVHVQEKNAGNAVISIRRRRFGGADMGFVIHAQGEESSSHFSESWCASDISMRRGGRAEI
jgi:hypothetical protein